ncbi:MAG: hypothetical protein P4N60_14940 [Verrucomicrobiae bacterium]|nr:hypothetical protein [Verrucomicrobiae bacterium]
MALAFVPLWLDGRLQAEDCTLLHFLWLSAILAAICFAGVMVLVFLVWYLKPFLRWLFTWRILKRCLLVFLFLLALVFVFYAEENWRGHRAWENYKHQLESKGERLDFASFIPPKVPDDQNFAFASVVQTSWNWLLDTNGHRLSAENTNIIHRLEISVFRTNQFVSPLPELPRADWRIGVPVDMVACQYYYRVMLVTNRFPVSYPHSMPGEYDSFVTTNYINPADTNEMIEIMALATNEFPVAPQAQAPAADVLLALSKFDVVLGELGEAAKRPQSRFPLNYDADDPLAISVPHYAPLTDCVHALSLRASAELAAKKSALAVADIQLILRLMDSIHAEPVIFAENYRLGWFRSALQPVWEGLAGNDWTEAQLIELDAALSWLNFVADYVSSVHMEAAVDVSTVEYCRRKGNKKVFAYLDGNDEDEGNSDFKGWVQDMSYRLFPDGWYAQGKLLLSEAAYKGNMPAVDLKQRIFLPGIYSDTSDRMRSKIELASGPWKIWARMLYSSNRPKQFAKAQAWRDLARVAIALERHRLAVGTYPESLDALSPRFLEKVPPDVINGQPLHYRRTADGRFLLYSIGWDGVDDGGVIFKTDQGRLDEKKGDWVWMFPAIGNGI